MQVCPRCQHDNRIGEMFCQACGSPLLQNEVKSGLPCRFYVRGEAWFLLIYGTKLIARRDTLADQQVILGRGTSAESPNTLHIQHQDTLSLGISRQHAALLPRADGVWVSDLDSANGTYLNRRKLVPHMRYQLENGDRLQLGQLEVTVVMVNHTTGLTNPRPTQYLHTSV